MSPWEVALDEVLSYTCMIPMLFTNLSAQLDQVLACSDASTIGGGVAQARAFTKRHRRDWESDVGDDEDSGEEVAVVPQD